MKKWLIRTGIVLLLMIPCGEIAARILGWKPYKNHDYHVKASPSNWLIGDSEYGIRLNPGEYEITLENKLKFQASHTEDGRRVIPNAPMDGTKVGIFGCSFTYGYGVNDQEPFPALLQAELPTFSFVNYAVPGWGELQSLMKLEELVQEGSHPDLAVLVYSEVHRERNPMATSYRSDLGLGFANSDKRINTSMKLAKFPFWDEGKIAHVSWLELYSNWWGRQSMAVVNALQTSLESDPSENDLTFVTKEVFDRFVSVCEQNDIELIIVNLDDSKFDRRYDIEAIDVGFDFSSKKLTNRPIDRHPNPSGHEFIASKILPKLSSVRE